MSTDAIGLKDKARQKTAQKLRRSKQRIGISDARENGKKYSDLPKKSVDFVPVLW